MNEFDNIVIGAGPAGYEVAALLSQKGESVCIVERDTPGGTCLNRGCIPTKCLVATSSAAAEAREASRLGVGIGEVTIDFAAAASRMKSVVEGLVDGVKGMLKPCTFVKGEAKLTGNHSIEVDGTAYTATKRMVIATGSKPAMLPVPGAELCLTSDDVLKLESLPESMVIIGGGVIGIEFASIFNDLGVNVSVIEYCPEILPPFDKETAKRLRSTMSRRGVKFTVGAKVTGIEKYGEKLTVTYEGKKGAASEQAEIVLMAVGRRPVLPEGIENTNVNVSPKGFIDQDKNLCKAADGIYAIGDVNGMSMLAHSAYAQARAVAFENPELFTKRCVPSIVFSRPEVAQVGMTPDALDKQGIACKAVKHLYASNGKAQAAGTADGFVKILADSNDTIVGVSIIGAHAADLIAEATILVQNGVKVNEIASDFIHAHPTLSELYC